MAGDGTKTGGGSRAGKQNHISRLAKENIETVFDMIGGLNNMKRWAKENETEFYRHYARLIPVQVSGDPDSPLQITLTKVIKNARD